MTDILALLAAGDVAAARVAKVLADMAKADGPVNPDALKAVPCPTCERPVNVLSSATRNFGPLGLPVGLVDIEVDFAPMADHLAACATGGKS